MYAYNVYINLINMKTFFFYFQTIILLYKYVRLCIFYRKFYNETYCNNNYILTNILRTLKY